MTRQKKYKFQKYNFSKLFESKDKIINTTDYVSNTHFAITKTNLKNNQIKWINENSEIQDEKYSNIVNMINGYKTQTVICDFVPQRIILNRTMKDDKKRNIILMQDIIQDKDLIYAIDEKYYNLITDLDLKIKVISNNNTFPLAIYNSSDDPFDGFCGIVLPIRITEIEDSIPYTDYINKQIENEELKQEQKQEQHEQKEESSKKCLYIKDNKAIVRTKELHSFSSLVNDESYHNIYYEKIDTNYGLLYIDFGFICYHIKRGFYFDRSSEELKENHNHLLNITLQDFKNYIMKSLDNNCFINVAEIKLMELAGEPLELIEKLKEHRENYIKRKEEQDKLEEQERQEKETQYVNEKNSIANTQVQEVIQKIKNKQEVKNDDITFYKSNRYNSTTTSIFLHLFRLYNIKVPLKTQGWIKEALATVRYTHKEDGGCWMYDYYSKSKNSTVFYEYLQKLIDKITT
jgi:hypothetical protein